MCWVYISGDMQMFIDMGVDVSWVSCPWMSDVTITVKMSEYVQGSLRCHAQQDIYALWTHVDVGKVLQTCLHAGMLLNNIYIPAF